MLSILRIEPVEKPVKREFHLPSKETIKKMIPRKETVKKMIPRVVAFGAALGLGLLAHGYLIIRLQEAATRCPASMVREKCALQVIIDEQNRWFVVHRHRARLPGWSQIKSYNSLEDLKVALKRDRASHFFEDGCGSVEITDTFSFNQKDQNAALVEARDAFNSNGFEHVRIKSAFARGTVQKLWEFAENNF